MKTLKFVISLVILTQSNNSLASATSSDFEICHKIKQELIKKCSQGNQKECLQQADSHYEKCVVKVKAQFNENSPKKLAEKKKAQLLLKIKNTLPSFKSFPVMKEKVYCTSLNKCMGAELEKTVTTKKPFKIAEHEATVEAFTIFVEDTGYITDAEKNSGEFLACNDYPKDIQAAVGDHKDWRSSGFVQNAKHPIVCVSYRDIQAYIQWLNSKTRKEYRLPTRDEWLAVYASKTRKNCTDGGIGLVNEHCPGTYGTFQVKSFAANAFKLFDMNGNVQEWVDSCNDNCDSHLILGDSINQLPSQFNPCEENSKINNFRSSSLGFRLAIDAFDE